MVNGYGGTCFPKDVNALINFSNDNSINLNTIKGGWKLILKLDRKRLGRTLGDL